MESFFSTPKAERTARKVYCACQEGIVVVFDCIERFYYPRRRYSNLGCFGPMEFVAREMLTCLRPKKLKAGCP